MSLNRALGELFKVIREEAAANPEFALKLEAALGTYKPSARAKQAARAKLKPAAPGASPEIAAKPAPPPTTGVDEPGELEIAPESAFEPAFEPAPPARPAAPALNPISLFTREGEAALRRELEGETYSREALEALVYEHNLDPAGQAEGAEKHALVDQIVAQAKRRVERDAKLFDY